MLVKIFFDVLIVALVWVIVKKIRLGVFIAFFARIFIPYYVRFSLGPIEIAMNDVISFALVVSLFLHVQKRDRVPKKILIFLWLPLISGFFLMLFSSAVVPYGYQITSLMKNLFLGEIVFFTAFFYCARFFDHSLFCKTFLVLSIVSGLYGLFAYGIGMNPYMSFFSYTYTGKDYMFSVFLDEIRGFLVGRTSGIFPHPLNWGQFWNIAIPFLLIVQKELNKKALYFCCCIGAVNVVLSGSRAALLALFVSVALYFLSIGLKKFVLYLFVLIVFAFFVVLFPINSNIFANDYFTYLKSVVFFWDDSYGMSLGIDGSNAAMRQRQMDAVIDFISSNPVAGVGYNYQYYCLANIDASRAALMGMESVLFKKLVEQGIAGMFFFCVIMWMLYQEVSKRIKSYRDYLRFVGFFLGFIVSACVTGMQGCCWVLFVTLNFLLYFYYGDRCMGVARDK